MLVCVCGCVCVLCLAEEWQTSPVIEEPRICKAKEPHRAAIVLLHSVGVIIKGSTQKEARMQCTQTDTQRATQILYVQVYITAQMDVIVSAPVLCSNLLHVYYARRLSFCIILNILS